MWQVLPDAVEAVFVGPDDRIWHQLQHPAQREDVQRVRRIIEQQFQANSPQVFGAQPALFERSGRVWFLTHSRTTLLGYDGREWIEYSAPAGHFFTGNCPNHGRKYRYGWNTEVDGMLFFPDSHGVHVFDGRDWHYQRMVEESVARGMPVTVLREPAKASILAVISGSPPALWRWAAREWRAVSLKSDQVENILPSTGDGVWLLTKNNGMEWLPFAEEKPPRETVEDLFARLKSAGGDEERQAIGNEMIRRGALAKPDVERALGRTYDSGVLAQLIHVLEILTAGGPSVAIGPYEITKAYLLYCDGITGQCFLRADNVRKEGTPIGKGLLVLNGANGPLFFPREELLQGWLSAYSEASGPIPAADGRGLWFETWGEEKKPRLLDPAAGRIVDAIPVPGFRWVHAARRDGTVFVGTREPGQSSVVLAAYRPGRKDDRNLLPASACRLREDSGGFCVDSAGAIWAVLDDGGMRRFDDGQWRPIPELAADSSFRLLLPGAGRRMIGQSQQGFFYCTPESFSRHAGFRDLIAAHHEDIARHFTSAAEEARCIGAFVTGVVADKAGNIWLMESRSLSVFREGRWLTAKPALISAGSRIAEVEYLNTVGGRGRVYVSDFMSVHSGGKSYFGGIENGQPVFAPAPHTCDRREMCLSVRDPQDHLWIAGSIRSSGGTCDCISGQLALRAADAGVVEEIKNAGWAKLCDKAGNVWLGQIRGGQPGEYRIWRNGRIAGQISVPTADDYSRLISDAPGSVYVWTASGLYHLIAVGSPESTDFKVEGIYTVTDAPGNVEQLFLSDQGWLALATWTDTTPRGRYVCLARLPKRGEK